MLIKGFAVVAGRKRLFLLGVLLFTAITGGLWLDRFAVTFTLIPLLLALSLVAATRYHPAVLFVRPEVPAFTTAVNLVPVFTAAAFIILAGALVSEDIDDIVDGEALWFLNATTAGLWVLVVALHLYGALGSFGVRLQPEGLYDRRPFGSLFIPWDAFAAGYPAVPVRTSQLALYYERPELIRRRGLRPSTRLLPTTTDATYLARAIHQYVTCPEHRPAIGTEAELRRLTGAGSGPAPGTAASPGWLM